MSSTRTRYHGNNNKVFLLSGIPNEKRQDYGKMIRCLGGVYFDIESFKSSCTHVVCGKLSRSEKFLGGCATGKWILKPGFIEDSYINKKWLQEEAYEWTERDACKSELKDISSAPRRWRESFLLNHSSFSGFNAALLVEGTKRKAVYKRLLTCGGATMFNLNLPITNPEKISSVLQYIFADKSLAAKHIPASLLDYGILCLSPDYIGDFLIKETPPHPCDYLVVGPHAILSSLSKACNEITDSSICLSQDSKYSSHGKNNSSVGRISPCSSQSTNHSISPVKPSKSSIRVLPKKQKLNTSKNESKSKLTPVGQKQLNQFGFISLKKLKAAPVEGSIEAIESESKKIVVEKNVNIDLNEYEENIDDTKTKKFIPKRLAFTSDTVEILGGVIEKTDYGTPVVFLGSLSPVKRKLNTDDLSELQPERKMAKFGPIINVWKPSIYINSYKSQFDKSENEIIVTKELPMCIANIIESCVEADCLMAGLNLISTSISSKYYLPSTTLHSLMTNVLLESPTVFETKKAFTLLMNHLSLHPPINEPLEAIYYDSLAVSHDENTENNMWSFVSSAMEAAVNEVISIEEELYRNIDLLKYILAVFEVNFKHFLNRLESGNSGKTTHRSCLFIQYLWSPGFQLFSNKRSHDLLKFFEDCLMSPGTSKEKLDMLEILSGFITLAAQCFKLAESDWIIKNNILPNTGNRSRSYIVAFSRKIINSHIEDVGVLEMILQTLTPSWFCLGVSAQLLSTYDDYLLLEGVNHTPLTLSRIVTQYFFLLPRLQCKRARETGQDVLQPAIQTRENESPYKVKSVQQSAVKTPGKIKIPDKHLIQKINKKNMKGETPLHTACIKNDVRRVKLLLTVPGINVNAVDNYGWSPLHEACNHGHIECVELLLKYSPVKTVESYFSPGREIYRKVDLLAGNVEGISALHDAVLGGWTNICHLLLKYGGPAILEAKTVTGKRPEDCAETEELRKILSKNTEVFSGSQDSQSSTDFRSDWLPTDCLYQEVLGDRSRVSSVDDCYKFLCLINSLINAYISAHRLCLLQETIKKYTSTSHGFYNDLNSNIRKDCGNENDVGPCKLRVNGTAVMKFLELTENQLRQGYKDLKVLNRIRKYITLFEKHIKLITTEEDFNLILPKVNFLKCSLSSI